jgi:demethylmenaquinone methyltransferase/2-methoxy-6-polyprenyl-1,4-benzoquinol methylase
MERMTPSAVGQADRAAPDRSTGPDKSPERIAGMFDAIAGRYDFLNHVLSAGLDRRWRRRAVAELALSGRERVVDLCTGTCDLAIAAATASPAASAVVGVDFAAEMLRRGQAKLLRRKLARRIRLVRGDSTSVPLADLSADAVMIAFGVRNVQEPAAAIAEAFRILRPGGRLVILEFGFPRIPGIRALYRAYFRFLLPVVGGLVSRHRQAYSYLPASVGAFQSPEVFAALLRSAGLGDVRAVPLTLGIVYLFMGRRPPR